MGTVDRSDAAAVATAEPDLLRPAEVASLFDVTPKTIARWNEAGILAGHRTEGGHRRYPATAVHELHAFLEGVGAS
jgi:excisionase family DNA binding protein